MTDDATQIRALITGWAEAVHRGDIEGVMADHTEDLVMYDVPPPHSGIHGLAAYRATWPPFFDWQAQGACFDIDSLDITALHGCRLRPCPAPVRHPRGVRRIPGPATAAHLRPAQGAGPVAGRARTPFVPARLTHD